MLRILLVALGGMIGTLARYGTGVALRGAYERSGFPFATLAVNLAGCFAIGLLHGMFAERWPIREEYRIALVVGVLGGFTTFSSFGWDTAEMLREGQLLRAGANVIVQNVLGIALVFLGYALARGSA
jgi:fluoride exporter